MTTIAPYRITLEEPGGNPLRIENDVENWKDIQIKIGRSVSKHGVMREYSNNYALARAGGKLLRQIYYSQGSEAKCKIRIEKRMTTVQTYIPFILTDLDFSKFSDERDACKISAMEAGPAALVKAYEDTEYQIPIDGPEVVNIDIPARLIEGEIKWISSWPIPAQYPDLSPFNSIGGTFYYVEVSDTMFSDVNGPPINATTQIYAGYPTSGTWSPTFDGLLKANKDIYDLRFNGVFKLFMENTSGTAWGYSVRLSIIPAGSSTDTILTLLAAGTVQGHTDTHLTININTGPFTLANGDRIIMYVHTTAPNGSMNIAWEKDSYLTAKFKNYATAFTVQGLRAIDVFKRLIAKMTSGAYQAQSDLLSDRFASYVTGIDNRPYDTVITSGDAVRNTITSGSSVPVLKIKFSDFLKSSDVWWSSGLSYEDDIIRLEKKGRYYDANTLIYDLGEPKSVTITHTTDYHFNKINIGYESQDYDNLNGRDEFNTTQVYSSSVTTTKNELDLISPIRADGYGIFFTWIKYATTDSTDSSSDNSLFAIEIESSALGNGHYKTLHLPGTYLGVIDPTNSFNWGLSPKRCLLRQGAFIRSCFYGLDGEFLTWQTTDKNAEMECTLIYGRVDESADQQIGLLESPLFQPMNFAVDAVSRDNLIDALNNTPFGVLRIKYREASFDLFSMEAAIKPALPEDYNFKTLSSPKNNLSNLVK